MLDEHGHVRISDLGLACDFSKKKPHASVGTHGYMAPEVLSKGTCYDSSADWFSFGCMLYKLLKGHSPFRQHKTKDKHEIDRMTLTMNVELPDTFSQELKNLLEGLLQVRTRHILRWLVNAPMSSRAFCSLPISAMLTRDSAVKVADLTS